MELLDGLSRFSERAVGIFDAWLRREIGFGYAQLRVLRAVVAQENISTVRVAREIDCSRANVDHLCGLLVAAGFLTRARGLSRADQLRVTELGYNKCRTGEAIVIEHADKVLCALAGRHRDLLAKLFDYSRSVPLDDGFL